MNKAGIGANNITARKKTKGVIKTELWISLIKAFAVGGAICAAVQIAVDLTKLTPGRILVILVTLGVVLTAAGVYGPFAEWAGAGATIPLTGFGYAMAEGVKQAVKESGLFGVLTGPLTASAGGITAAMLCGLIASFFAKPKEK